MDQMGSCQNESTYLKSRDLQGGCLTPSYFVT